MRQYSHDQIAAGTDLRAAMAALDACLRSGERGAMLLPPRALMMQPQPPAMFVSMAAVSAGLGLYINKIASVVRRVDADPLPTVHALVLAFSSRDGQPLALLDGAALTNLKCAAVSALVNDYCAAPDAGVLAIVGCGVQGWQQYRAACAVRAIAQIRLVGRSRERRARFAAALRADCAGRIEIEEVDDIECAIDGADIVATATTASAPLAAFASLAPHVHVNCMGGHTPAGERELPQSVLRAARLIVEDRATAIAEAGELHREAIELDALAAQPPAALRQRRTVFSSTGHAYLDLITTAHALRALASGA